MTLAFVAVGSNLGDRLETMSRAVAALGASQDVRVVAVSHAFSSEPWGVTAQPEFANAVVAVECELDATSLLALCQRIEGALGRRGGERFGPRPIDLDIVLFGRERVVSPTLTVPHPRMLERDFVVTPLLEIAPDASMPDGAPVTGDDAVLGRVTGVLGVLPGFAALTPARAEPGVCGC